LIICLVLSFAAASKMQSKLKTLLQAACSPSVYDLTIQCDGSETTMATFDAKNVISNSNTRGWVLTISSPGQILNRFLEKAGTDYIIPYRLVTKIFEPTMVDGTGKLMASTFQVPTAAAVSQEFHSCTFTFTYDPVWEVIGNRSLRFIVNSLNTNRATQIAYIQGLKDTATTNASSYINNIKAASVNYSQKSDVDKQIADFNAQILALQQNSATLNATITTNKASINDQQATINTLTATCNGYQSDLTLAQASYNSQQGTLTTLQSNSATASQNTATYKSNYDSAYSQVQSLYNTYKPECADQGSNLDAALTALQSLDMTTFKSKVKAALT